MAPCVYIVNESTTRLWGLTSRERLKRTLQQSGVSNVVDDLASIPSNSVVLLLRGDCLYDGRVLKSLVQEENLLLQLPVKQTQVAVAAVVPASLVHQARNLLSGAPVTEDIPQLRKVGLEALTSSLFQEQLLKSEPPYVLPISEENIPYLEQRLFSGSYKGVTDLVTKWVWPWPAQHATRFCVRFGIVPNVVTGLSVVLTILAGALFMYGMNGMGLMVGWFMTFLDTVDGKLARVTLTSSKFGHALDKGLDIIHPPLWYIMWGLGLSSFNPGVAWLSLADALWLIVIGYILGRLCEGTFQVWLGWYGIFCWRPFDSYIRLITARRNPNLILLTGSLFFGRPDLGLVAVAVWTTLSTLLLVWRLMMALSTRMISGPLRPWMAEARETASRPSLADKLFNSDPAQSELSGRG